MRDVATIMREIVRNRIIMESYHRDMDAIQKLLTPLREKEIELRRELPNEKGTKRYIKFQERLYFITPSGCSCHPASITEIHEPIIELSE